LLFLLAVIYGLYLSIFVPIFSFDGLPALSYFTVQSNILVVLFTVYVMLKPPVTRFRTIARGSVLLYIAVTGLVFHIILVPYYPEFFAGGVSFRHHLTHTIAPLGFFLDWLLFDHGGLMKVGDIKYWLIYPFLYFLFSTVRGLFVGAYPYFFMDLNLLSPGSVLFWFLALGAFFVLLGLLIVLIDARRPGQLRKAVRHMAQ
jgi:hypothetical protein